MNQSISSLIKLKFLQSHSNDKNGNKKGGSNVSTGIDKLRESESYRSPFIQLAEIQEHTNNDDDKLNVKECEPTKKHSKLSRIRRKMGRLDLNFRSANEKGSEDDEILVAQHLRNGQDPEEMPFKSENNVDSIEKVPKPDGERVTLASSGSDNIKRNSKHAPFIPVKPALEKFPSSNRLSRDYRKSQEPTQFNGDRLVPTLPTVSRISTSSSVGSSTAASRYFNPSKRAVVASSSSSSSSIKFNSLHAIPLDATPQIELAKQQDEISKRRFGRRRSRTVDVFDYINKNNTAKNKPPLSPSSFIRTIDEKNTNSLMQDPMGSREPLLPDDANIISNDTNGAEVSHPDHQVLSRSRSQSTSFVQGKDGKRKSIEDEGYQNKLGLPHGSGPASVYNNKSNANSTITGMSRRSSSIVNALSSFVNLRSSSLSSSRQQHLQQQQQLQQKLDVSLEDLPPVPAPEFSDSCKDFLIKLAPYGKFIGIILTEKDDEFKKNCLNYLLTNCFEFKNDPLDIALRKLLMFLELPKETQQIDRLIMAFSFAYYKAQKSYSKKKGIECPWSNADQVYFIAFSLLMLHTDYFNPNNKSKMTKHDFVDLVHNDKYSGGNEIPMAVLTYFYENVTAKESPKFNYFLMSPMALDDSILDKDAFDTNFAITLSSNSMYSPIDMIKRGSIIPKEASLSPIFYPLTNSISASGIAPSTAASCPPNTSGTINGANLGTANSNSNRPASNSISSYFSYNPSSSSSGNATIVQDDINVYSHIINDTLNEENLFPEVSKYWNKNALKANLLRNEEHKYEKYYSIMNDTKGGYLRFHKSQLNKLNLPNFEILNDNSRSGCKNSDYKYCKILQMGGIMNLGMPSRKFSIVNSAKIHWKKEFAILTSFGLLICDKMDWINPQMMKDPKSGTTNYIIDFKSGFSFVPGSTIDVYNGLFADRERDSLGKSHFASLVLAYTEHHSTGSHTSNTTAASSSAKHNEGVFEPSSDEEDSITNSTDGTSSVSNSESDNDSVSSSDNQLSSNDSNEDYHSIKDEYPIFEDENADCLLYLHTCHRNFIWKCANKYERDNWIDSINLFSAYDGCYVEIGSIANTICNKRKLTILQRMERLRSIKSAKWEKLKKFESTLMLMGKCVPISTKTKTDMINRIRQLAVRMDWLIYEIKRSELFVSIIKEVTRKQAEKNILEHGKGEEEGQGNNDDSDGIDDIEESFLFNEDSLQVCVSDSSYDEYSNE
ncbi:HN1_G0025060.mRNA.1.CDS.1 [Saccharomyces cerevisiae]|nr:HN1_G0025060.mRNA.1.CDS.1 [Saccharomyces cerevisiae]CAI4820678.1 BAL_1a_G0055790.mRNA.1.CDS.1 [Saccharomyces cerevisiae]CAI7389128.1 BAL_1a_G0055790.mRNA.1.CDS.1 [Saccharomyces cerevisiae]